jgi:peptide/nickel transport system substrate-binding protein
MAWKRALALLLALAFCLSLAGCGRREGGDASASVEPESSADRSAPVEDVSIPPREEEEEALPFGLGYYEGLGLNPYTCDNVQNQSLMGLLYEPLYELDEHFEAQPVLAQSISAKSHTEQRAVQEKKKKNGETQTDTGEETKTKTQTVAVTDVTIRLREDAKFSDGATLRADDVEYSLRRAAAKGSVYRTRLGSIRNLRSSGRSAVKFTIDGGAQCVAELLDVPIIKNGDGDKLFPVGSGPYAAQRNKKGKLKTLVANENWWRKGQEYQVALSQGVSADESGEGVLTRTVELPVQRIRIYNASDSDELIFGFSSGAVTAVGSDLTAPDALGYLGGFDVTDYATTDLLYLGCNTDEGPCQEKKLRGAIYRSIDRDTIVERMMAGHAEAACLPVHPNSALWDSELAEKLVYNREKAAKLCKDTGVTSQLKLIVNKESEFKVAAAREVARHLETAGLDVKVERLSWKKYRTALKEGDYDLYFGEVLLSGNFDLSQLLLKGGSLNFSKYDSDELSAAEKSYRQAGRDTRAKAASKLFALLSDEAPVVPVCFKSASLLSRTGTLSRSRATQSNLFHWFWDWVLDEDVVKASEG